MGMDAHYIIEHLNLKPLPYEGGYFRETYRSDEIIPHAELPPRYSTEKGFSTAIYYLITSDSFSALHRIKNDEVFHFYQGEPVTMLQLFPDGTGKTVVLGNDLERGHVPQCVVPRMTWQGLLLEGDGEFALMGTTVAPSFDSDDFEFGGRSALVSRYPQFAGLIKQLTREDDFFKTKK